MNKEEDCTKIITTGVLFSSCSDPYFSFKTSPMYSLQKKVWIHLILTLQTRNDIINTKYERMLYAQIRKLFYETGCLLNIVNGTEDHIHCLFNLNSELSVDDVVNYIKNNSTNLIGNKETSGEKINWKQGYYAFSVSDTSLTTVIRYIQQQKKIHQQITLEEETEDYAAQLIDNIFGFDKE
jgi:REP element-mobilizing transposase RayT